MNQLTQKTCKHPDHDCPKLLCGHPIPCPWHTVTIDISETPPTVTIPATSRAGFNHMEVLQDIAEILHDTPSEKGE